MLTKRIQNEIENESLLGFCFQKILNRYDPIVFLTIHGGLSIEESNLLLEYLKDYEKDYQFYDYDDFYSHAYYPIKEHPNFEYSFNILISRRSELHNLRYDNFPHMKVSNIDNTLTVTYKPCISRTRKSLLYVISTDNIDIISEIKGIVLGCLPVKINTNGLCDMEDFVNRCSHFFTKLPSEKYYYLILKPDKSDYLPLDRIISYLSVNLPYDIIDLGRWHNIH